MRVPAAGTSFGEEGLVPLLVGVGVPCCWDRAPPSVWVTVRGRGSAPGSFGFMFRYRPVGYSDCVQTSRTPPSVSEPTALQTTNHQRLRFRSEAGRLRR